MRCAVESLLSNPRIRMILFGLVAVFLVGLAIWSATASSSNNDDLAAVVPQPELEEPVAPVEGPSFQPSQVPAVPDISTKEVSAFLAATRTYDWQTDFAAFASLAVKSGAVPGSAAATPPLQGEALAGCIAARCASEFVKATDIRVAGDEITADVTLRQVSNGQVQEDVVFCTIIPAPQPSKEGGFFVKSSCLGPGG